MWIALAESRRMLALMALLALGAAGALPAAAQEIGVAVGTGSSDFLELARPMSVAAHAELPLRSALRLRAGYRWSEEEDTRPGTTCDSYWPDPQGCIDEPIEYATGLRQWELGLTLGHALSPHFELRVGLLGVHNTLSAGSAGAETGRSAGNAYPDGSVWSTALLGEVAWKRLLGGRIGAVGRIRHERLDFRGCVEDAGAPFCAEEGVLSFELGIVLGLRPIPLSP